MDTYFLKEKIQDLKEKLTIAKEENKSLRDYIHDLEANQTASGNSRSQFESPILFPDATVL